MIYYGVVEDRKSDPLKLGRCKVRIVGIHTEDSTQLPTADLPWAMIMQPTTSSANSGLGYSPVGIVEGTWVVVMFRDEYNQTPIIIGTLPGIPTSELPSISTETSTVISEPIVVRSGDGSVITDGSGQPVVSGYREVEVKKNAASTELKTSFKKPSLLSISDEGINQIKKDEGLSSLEPFTSKVGGKIGVRGKEYPSTTKIYPYLDSAGILTIGYGSTNAVFKELNENTIITYAKAVELLKSSINSDFTKSARSIIRVPLTQSMFDACISMIYNMGAGTFQKTAFLSTLNSGKYEAAAALIPTTVITADGKVLQGLKNRRKSEYELFIKDGIPQDDGTVKEFPKEDSTEDFKDETQNPVVKPIQRDKDSDSKIADKENSAAKVTFSDPNKKYPIYLNEPDTHRLARHEKLEGTIVYKKEAGRTKGIPTANGSTWNQPRIPYNAKYPHNRVFASESGHVQEFDDTPNNERYHLYHKSGTFTEIDVNGTVVNKIIGDSFQILERNGNVFIRGACNITVEGSANIRVENNTTLESLGNLDIKVGGDVGIGAGGSIRLASGGEISLDGSAIHLNSGKGGSVKKASGGASGEASLPPLQTPNRFDEVLANYETDEEGMPSAEHAEKVKESDIDPASETESDSEQVQGLQKPDPRVIETSCDLIFKEKTFTGNYRLSPNFTLLQVVTANDRIPTGTCYGKTANEIICNLKVLSINVLEPIKKRFPNMLITNSWRSEAHNERVGGSKTSKHMTGQAVDIVFSNFNRKQTYEAAIEIQKILQSYDKIILEYNNSSMWVHIQFMYTGNRHQCFTMWVHKSKTSPGFVLTE